MNVTTTSASLAEQIKDAMEAAVANMTSPHDGHNNNNNTANAIMAAAAATVTAAAAKRQPFPAYVHMTHFVCEQVLIPIVCCLGIIGNSLSLCVLTRREMAAATTCFLTAMAASDLMLLSLSVPTFFKQNSAIAASDSYLTFESYFTIIRYVLTNVFVTCTCWLTVAVTIERFISLRFMFRPKLVCTVPRARAAIIGIFVLSFVFHFSKFFEYIPNLDLSQPKRISRTKLANTAAYEAYSHVTNIALSAFIPIITLIVVNGFLVYFLATHKRRMLRHKTSITSNMSSVDMLHITAIVVATVLVFIACTAVSAVIALTIAAEGMQWVFAQPSYRALKSVNNLLLMVNSCVNFLLYTTISRKFRRTFVALFRRWLGLSRQNTWTSGMPLSESNGQTTLPRPGNGKYIEKEPRFIPVRGGSNCCHGDSNGHSIAGN